MEKIISSKLMIVSGWGTGLAVLFSIFNGHVSWVGSRVNILDNLLSVSAVIFFMLLAVSFVLGLKENNKSPVFCKETNKIKNFAGILFSLIVIFGGWFFIGYVQDAHGETNSAIVLGSLLAGSGLIAAYVGVIRLFKRRI